MTRVGVIGKDARTDCLAEVLCDGDVVLFSLCDYRNPGLIRKSKEFFVGKTDDPDAVMNFARDVRPDLLVVGPEEPLAAGVVDVIEDKLGIPCVGPRQALARIETSKAFARRLLTKYNIAGKVEHRIFESSKGLEDYLRHLGQFVVKPDGLTGGKGVKVYGEHLASVQEAVAYAGELFKTHSSVIVEEKLEGEEFSLQSLCDGETVRHTIPVQDHKRASEGDTGPNTGGMGSYSCEDQLLPFLTQEQLEVARQINEAVAKALYSECRQPYRGILYGGFMLTAKGVRLLEYNARFGDPEAMNVLPLLKNNFLEVCQAIASGTLGRMRVEFRRKATVCKYVVPMSYPKKPEKLTAIDLSNVPHRRDDLRTYFAGVDQVNGTMLLTGSRAVAFVGIADTIKEAQIIAETAASGVGGFVSHRKDIGTRELLQKSFEHIKALTTNG